MNACKNDHALVKIKKHEPGRSEKEEINFLAKSIIQEQKNSRVRKTAASEPVSEQMNKN
jgi:hypothetical protein